MQRRCWLRFQRSRDGLTLLEATRWIFVVPLRRLLWSSGTGRIDGLSLWACFLFEFLFLRHQRSAFLLGVFQHLYVLSEVLFKRFPGLRTGLLDLRALLIDEFLLCIHVAILPSDHPIGVLRRLGIRQGRRSADMFLGLGRRFCLLRGGGRSGSSSCLRSLLLFYVIVLRSAKSGDLIVSPNFVRLFRSGRVLRGRL